jgi:hypothetical protein
MAGFKAPPWGMLKDARQPESCVYNQFNLIKLLETASGTGAERSKANTSFT